MEKSLQSVVCSLQMSDTGFQIDEVAIACSSKLSTYTLSVIAETRPLKATPPRCSLIDSFVYWKYVVQELSNLSICQRRTVRKAGSFSSFCSVKYHS